MLISINIKLNCSFIFLKHSTNVMILNLYFCEFLMMIPIISILIIFIKIL